MSRNYRNTLNRTIYLSLAFVVTLAAFAVFRIEPSQASQNGSATAPIAPAFVDTTFNPVVGASNGQIVDNFVQADGKVIITGLFSVLNGTNKNAIARFNADGTLDTTFNTGAGPNDSVFSVDQQADGKLIIGGQMTAYDGTPVGRIARLNTDGSLDTSFNAVGLAMNPNAGANNIVSKVKVLSDGKIMIGGVFTNYNGTNQNRLARLNADGSLDTTFAVGTGPTGEVICITPLSDGKIMIGGNFVQYNSNPTPRLARINADGSYDSSFAVASGANQTIRSVTVQPDGKIIASGFMTGFAGLTVNGIVRVNTDGSVDQTFNVAGLDAVVIAVALQPDGKMIIGGSFTQMAGVPRPAIARLNADGTNDATFTPGTGVNPQIINDITLLADGRAIVNGTFAAYNGIANGGAIRINADGTHDTNLATQSAAVGNFQTLTPQADGKTIIGGTFSSVSGTPRSNIARLNADGSNDASFNVGSGANSTVLSSAVQTDGKVIIGGNFTAFNGTTGVNRIVRLNSDGTIDSSFNTGTGANGSVDSMLLLSDGKILIGGGFAQYNGTVVNRFARLNSDGTLDTSFNTGTSVNNGIVRQITLQPDGKILIGGSFTTYNAIARARMARVNADGTLDTTFDPGVGPNNQVNSFALHPDGSIVIGGTFTQVAGVNKAKLAKLNANGTLDTGFDIAGAGPGPGTGPAVTKVLAVEGGRTIVTGSFQTFNGLTKNRLVRVNANGTIDHTFLNGQGAQAQAGLVIGSLVRQPDGMILIGGQFTVFNMSARSGLARFKNATDTYADFDGDGKTDFSVMQRQSQFGQWTWWVNYSSTNSLQAFDFGLSPSDIAQPADYDGDGTDDVAVWRAAGINSGYYIAQSGTNTVRFIAFGQNGDVPMTEDYDGDGRDDLSVWRAPSSSTVGQATWYYLGSLNNPNNNLTYVPWGMRYGTESTQVDKPYPGDFDGDGRADFRVSRRADTSVATANTAAVFYTLSATGAFTQDYWGWASDKTLPGDYDGDGKTDLAVARGFNQGGAQIVWWIRYTGGQADAAINWGTGGFDQFAQGDYDGDGTTDLATYRRAGENNFYVRRSSDQSMMVYHLGASTNDFAVANYNNR